MSVLATADHLTEHLAAVVTTEEPACNGSIFKRLVDVFAATVGLLAFAWLFLVIAVAIKLDTKGPVFFKQQRLGKDREPFTIFKFRTMVTDGDDLLRHGGDRGLLYKDLNDPRLTRVGRWLRRNSLDELPQLINIFKGEMCLVGPRPLPMEDTKYYEEWQWGRLAVMPGLTGLWQVSGRSRLDSNQMVRLDLYYIENWSAWLDTFIILKTFWVVLTRDGAY
ncbi:MAG: undecaprenyl-phosphate glucose phosphotransferase [Cyanobacteria bacterium RYN_339]|nr:undecaprenyl-phosphate glucose phosphotransferase [Cyanobacteria bacterium RYN_339]